jgi:hypothetical protein
MRTEKGEPEPQVGVRDAVPALYWPARVSPPASSVPPPAAGPPGPPHRCDSEAVITAPTSHRCDQIWPPDAPLPRSADLGESADRAHIQDAAGLLRAHDRQHGPVTASSPKTLVQNTGNAGNAGRAGRHASVPARRPVPPLGVAVRLHVVHALDRRDEVVLRVGRPVLGGIEDKAAIAIVSGGNRAVKVANYLLLRPCDVAGRLSEIPFVVRGRVGRAIGQSCNR